MTEYACPKYHNTRIPAGIELVKTRSEAMQYCSEMESGGMMTVFFGSNANIGLACEAARTWVNDNDGVVSPVCKVANFLYVGAKVIAGHNQVQHQMKKTELLHLRGRLYCFLGPPFHRGEPL